jgi:NadR type nicotinamide-nucleotide adenylyltransferase
VIRVCFHGAESTGKSTLIAKLEREHGWPSVPEFGRTWAETHGTDFTLNDLLAMARGQDAAMHAAAESQPPLLLLDTDPLMTAAWAQMLFGEAPAELFAYDKAELYLLFAPDTAWIADGTRFFGTDEERARFAALCEYMLVHADVTYRRVGGSWLEREQAALAAIRAAATPA